MTFPRYERYKDSGIEWIGEVPEHWGIKRLKYILRLLTEKTDRRENPVALENIESWSGRFIQTETIFEGEGIAFQCRDILFGKLRPYLAKIYLADSAGEAVGDFHVMRPMKDTNSRFAQYQILNREFITIVDGSTFGAKMPRVSWDFLSSMVLTTPPLSEQSAIAAFLDRETAKIDALIAEQHRLIELLKEKRQAVISHAVTKGLNPDVPMKNSGIEWLGEVPEHWGCFSLKYFGTIKTGYAFSSDDFIDEGIPILRIGDITTNGRVDLSNARFLPEGCRVRYADVLVMRDDIVIAMTGATIGKAGWYLEDEPALLNQRVCIFRATKPNSQRYLWHILNTRFYAEHIALTAVGGAQPNISDSALLHCAMPVPVCAEQTTIAAFLDSETAKLDTLTTEA